MHELDELPRDELGRIDWAELARLLGAPTKAYAARVIDISPNAWAKIILHDTKTPQGSTQVKVQNWIREKTGKTFKFSVLFPNSKGDSSENFRKATPNDNAA